MRFLLAALSLSVVASSPAYAFKERWVSEGGVSKTIIGSLTVDLSGNSGKIVFENGKTLPLRQVAGKNGLFQVDPPQDPILRRGTRLCGMTDGITQVELQASGDLDRRLIVWSGPNHCAEYPMFEKKAYDKLSGR